MKTHTEIERKLRVHALFRLPTLAGSSWGVAAVESEPVIHMEATYHDTPDLRLFRWGYTLRRRVGGADEGWHLKVPGGGDARDELQVPLARGEVGAVPAELRDIVHALVRRADLVPVVTLRTERTPHRLLNAAGTVVAELVDDTVSILDGGRVAAVFREIEVEGVEVDDQIDESVLDDVVALLVAEGAIPGQVSKAASALGPRAAAAPDVPDLPWPHRHAPARDALRALLATHTRRILAQDVRLRRDLPDAVHQMRVAARRIRSCLHTFRDLVDPEWSGHLRAELGWLAGELGRARDTEVIAERLLGHADQLDPHDAERARAALSPWFAAHLAGARDQALTAVRSERYLDLLEALIIAAERPATTSAADQPCSEVLPALLHRSFRRLSRAVRELDRTSPSAQWHEARIHAKRARYTAEAVAPVLGPHVQHIAARLADVTELLGSHQDAYVCQEALRERLRDGAVDAETGFALGTLHGVEGVEELRLRAVFAQLWPQVRRDYKRNRPT